MHAGGVLLGGQGPESGPFRGVLNIQVADPTPYRYIRVLKKTPGYLFIGKLRAFARPPDLAAGKPAFASSEWSAEHCAAKANDGGPTATGGWSPTGTEPSPFWQVDLGQPHSLARVDLVTRQDLDQPLSRQSFQIWASNSADMSGHVILAAQGPRPRPFRDVFMAEVDDPTPYRYIRVVKTVPDHSLRPPVPEPPAVCPCRR